jgi:photosystem II stability/assembly factor-like uncharacterized protein
MAKIIFFFFSTLFLLSVANVCFGQGHWQPCSGAPIGSIDAILTDSKGDVFVMETYLGEFGGIYESDATTQTWQCLTGEDFLQDEYFSCLAIDSTGTIYTNTEPSVAPYRSTDGGKTWKDISTNLPKTQIITSFVEVNTFACGRNGLLYAGLTNGVYLSSNKGSSWVRADSGLGGDTNVIALAINSIGTVFAATDAGLFRSTDNGNFWVLVDTGSVSALTIDFKDRILASSGQKLYRSTNEGSSWIDLNITIPDTSTISTIATDRTGKICVGTYTQWGFRSLDDGVSWLPFGSNLRDSDFFALAFNPNGDLFVGTNYSVIKSQNNGDSWNSVGVGIQSASVMPLPNGDIIAEGYGGGIIEGYGQTFLTTDEGDEWTEYPVSGFYSYCTSSSGSIFISFDTAVARSTNNGASWVIVYVEPRDISSMASDFNGDVFIIDNVNGIMRSTDDGNTWTIVNSQPNGFTWLSLFYSHGNLYASLDSVYGFSPASFFRSSDRGDTWQEVNNSFPGGALSIDEFSVGSDSKGNLYVTTNSYSGVIFRSTDSGFSWQEKTIPTDEAVVAFGNDSNGNIYCGLNGIGPPSILRSVDDGLSWSEFDDPSFQAAGSFATTPNGRIFVGTTAGVYRSFDSGVAGVREINPECNSDLFLPQNSPNPFTQNTTISFTLPEPSYITLTLYDATGREVATLMNGFMDAGEHDVPFERGNTPSGVYFYRLESGSSSRTRGMVIEP